MEQLLKVQGGTIKYIGPIRVEVKITSDNGTNENALKACEILKRVQVLLREIDDEQFKSHCIPLDHASKEAKPEESVGGDPNTEISSQH
jgi:hypothetical protein